MFLGHFAMGLAAKKVLPRVSLGTLFLASQFIDLLWPTFLLLGWERVQVAPGATVVTPLLFSYYPFSHSLLAVLVWAVVLGGLYWLRRGDHFSATVLGLLVLSHWLLDLVVHRPDLPLLPGIDILVGLHGWSSLPFTLLIEGGLFAVGMGLYLHATRARDAAGGWGFWALIGLLVLIYATNLLAPPPPDEAAIAWAGQLQWLLVGWGYWLDRHREVWPDRVVLLPEALQAGK